MLHNGLQVDQSVHKWHMPLVCSRTSSSCILKCKHTTLAISTLIDISPLHIQMEDYHLKYLNVPL